MGGSAGAGYSADDLAKEIHEILARLDETVTPEGSDELALHAEGLVQSRHDFADELVGKVRRAQRHFAEAEDDRVKAREELVGYSGPRFPTSTSRGVEGAQASLRVSRRLTPSQPPPPPPPPPPEPAAAESPDEKTTFAEIAAETRATARSFSERMRPVLAKVREWLHDFAAKLIEFIKQTAGQSRQWLLAHEKQIDAAFVALGMLSGMFGTWMIPLIGLTVGAPIPIWVFAQFGFLAAKTSWGIIKGDKNKEISRALVKKQAFTFAIGAVGIFGGQLPDPTNIQGYAAKLGVAMTKSSLKILQGLGDGKGGRKFVLKQAFGLAVDVADIFKDDIFTDGRLPKELGGLLTIWSRKDLAKDIYGYANPRRSWTEDRQAINEASQIVSREKWRRVRESSVRRWLLDRGEYIEGGMLRIGAIRALFGVEATEIIGLIDEYTDGIALRTWTAVQLGVAATNFAWRTVRGDSHGRVTGKHFKRQLLWAGVDILGIFSGQVGLGQSGGTLEFMNNVRFTNEWIGYTRRYVFNGDRQSSPYGQ